MQQFKECAVCESAQDSCLPVKCTSGQHACCD
jgi:hypothetical protein